MVEVSGFDCGKFLNVQSLSIVIWIGSGRISPSITPKYGGPLQNLSAPTAGEAVPSDRAKRTKRMSSGKPSAKPRDIRKRHGCSMPRVVSSSMPIRSRGVVRECPQPVAGRGRYRQNVVVAAGDSGLRGTRSRELPRGADRIGGRRRPAGTRRARNFRSEMASAKFSIFGIIFPLSSYGPWPDPIGPVRDVLMLFGPIRGGGRHAKEALPAHRDHWQTA